MRVIGVTGGVGAGKSTVLAFLKKWYDARIIQADEVGHRVMEPGTEAFDRVVELFGPGIVDRTGRIDRKMVAEIVFTDEEKRLALNAVIHPAVRETILRELQEARAAGRKFAVVEAALFLEENYDEFCDETWYIYADVETRRERLKASRDYSDERISRMMERQKSYEEFRERCQYMIDNSGTMEELVRQIDRRMMG